MKKFYLKIFAAVLISALLLPMQVSAETKDEFFLSGAGAVSIRSQQMESRGVSSLQFSLQIEAANATVTFQFASEIITAADVTEYQYHSDTGILDVYIAGTKSLFSYGANLSLGSISISNSYGGSVFARASVVENSVKYVYGADLITADITLPAAVTIGSYVPTPPPITAPTPTPTPTPTPASTPTPTPTPTSTPAPTLTPTPTPEETGPRMYKSLKLYLDGGDVTDTYPTSRYAVVWNKDGYQVTFLSENENIAKVGKRKGLVTAVGVGTTNVNAIFTNDAGETIIRTCKITVKRNAIDAGIGDGSQKKLQNLVVGDVFQAITYRTLPDGERVWNNRDRITDGVRFTSSDESVFTVRKTTGKITAVGAGEATLTVWAVQSENAIYKKGKLSEYRPTTRPRTYLVKVSPAKGE